MSFYTGFASELSKIAKDLIPGGLGDKKTDRDFNPEQLRKGIKVEYEHTKSRQIATEIARDHLSEDPRYYDKLELIEKD